MDIKLLLCLQFMFWMFVYIDKIKKYNSLKWHCRDLDRQIKESIEKDMKKIIKDKNIETTKGNFIHY